MTLFLALLLAGCTESDLSEDWDLDRMRVLAARSDPADIAPGETAELSSLSFDPAGEPVVLWALCPFASDEPCPTDEAVQTARGRDLRADTPEEEEALRRELAPLGILGVEPYLPPRLTLPPDALDGLPEGQARTTFSVELGLAAWSAIAPSQDIEYATKRVALRDPQAPNANPRIEGIEVGGELISADVVLDHAEPVDVVVILSDDSEQTYTFTDRDGVSEERTEFITPRLFTDFGAIDSGFSPGGGGGGGQDGDAINIQPEITPEFEVSADGEGEGELLVVATDGRGGFDWIRVSIRR